jgi:hypothetical protein
MPLAASLFGLVRPLLVRAVLIWILVHGGTEVAGRMGEEFLKSPAEPHPFQIATLCLILGFVDVRMRRERALWGNLGFPAWLPAAIFGLTAAIGESLVLLIVSLL